MHRNPLALLCGFVAAFLPYSVAAAPAALTRTIVVHRVIWQHEVTEIMNDGPETVNAGKGLTSMLGGPLFGMPEKYTLITERGSAEQAFARAEGALKCGSSWKRKQLRREDSFGELGELRSFYNDRCFRVEIVSRGKTIFEGLTLRHHLVNVGTAIH